MITARITGDTFRFRDTLKQYGYRWDSANKAWTKEYDSEVSEDRAVSDVRSLPGIRNRGNFSAEIISA